MRIVFTILIVSLLCNGNLLYGSATNGEKATYTGFPASSLHNSGLTPPIFELSENYLAPDVTYTISDINCYGSATGTIDITVTGTQGVVNYAWSDGPKSEDRTDLSAGTYSVTVTDDNGSTVLGVTITEPSAALTASVASQVNVDCFGQSTGSVVITPIGGTAPYVIAPAQTALSAGVYNFTITDSKGCLTTVNATITQPAAALTASLTSQVNVPCFGQATGSVIITPSGGTAPYVITPAVTGLAAGFRTFSVTDSYGCSTTLNTTITQPATALTASLTSQVNVKCFGQSTGSVLITPQGGTVPYVITPSQTALTAGLHTFTITDGNGCTTNVNATITQPTAILSVATTQVNVLCYGAANGRSTATPAGGTAPFTYSWNTSPVQTTQTATGLIAGVYTVTVTDANLCATTATVTITQPPLLTISAITSNTPICQGSTLNLSATITGGSPAYSYSWTGPNGFSSVNQNPTITNTLPNASGSYSFTVTDLNSCSTSMSTSVIVNPTPTVTATPTSQIICSGSTTSIAFSGSVTGTTFSWSSVLSSGNATGFTNGSGSDIAQTLINSSISSATVTYTVTPTANGCSGTPITVVITVNPIPIVTATPGSQTICTGGTTSISLSSATTGTTFTWTAALASGAASGFAGGSGSSISQTLINTSSTQAIVNYTFTPTANGCLGQAITVPVTINPNASITLTSAPETTGQTICVNNPIINIVYAIGGSGAGVTITSGALPSGVTGSYSSGVYTISGTPSATGTFLYTLTTTGPCIQSSTSGMITIYPVPTVTGLTDLPLCTGLTTSSISLSGPVPGTIFNWANNNTSIGLPASGTGNIPSFIATNSTANPISALITVTPSANGCNGAPGSFTITVSPSPVLSTPLSANTCSGAIFSYTPSSLTTGTTFGWSRSAKAGISNSAASGTGTINETLNNITSNSIAVTYIYTLTANGCSQTQNVTVTVVPAPTLTSTLTPTDICGNSPFVYTPTFTIAGTIATWNRAVNPNISNPASSGTGPINETLVNISSAPVDVVYVYTLNASGCTSTQNVTIRIKPSPVLSSSLTPAAICSNATFSYLATSLTSGTTYSWTRSAIAGINSNLPGGGTNNISEVLTNSTANAITVNYVYTLRANTCQSIQTVAVIVNPLTTASVTGTTTICLNSANPDVTFTGTGGMGPYTFTYNLNGGTNQTITTTSGNSIKLSAPTNILGTYSYNLVSVLNSTGCSQNQPGSAIVTVISLPTATISGTASLCQNSVISPLITFIGSNGLPPYTFVYTINGGSAQNVTTTSGNTVTVAAPTGVAGTFVYSLVSISSAAGCSQSQSGTATVTVNPLPVLTVTPSASTICNGGSTTLTASGATTYNWSPATGLSATTGSSVTANPTATTTYTVTGTNSNGCINSTTVTVTVRALSPISISPAAPVICVGGSVALTASGSSSYLWSPSADLSASNTASVDATPATTTTFTVTGTDVNGCASTKEVIVTVNEVPVLTSSVNLTPICSGSTFSYTPLATPSTGVTFSWSRPAVGGNAAASGTGSINELLNNNTSSPVGVNYLYTMATGGCSVTATVSVVVVKAPVVTASASKTSVCAGSSINLTSSSSIVIPIALPSENFNLATTGATTGPNGWTTTNSSTGGTPANAAWTVRASPYTASGTSLNSGDAKFYLSNSLAQVSTGPTSTFLQSPLINTDGYTSLALGFYHYYRDGGGATSGDTAKVQVSTNGTTWATVLTYTASDGSATTFKKINLALNGYVGFTTFYVRFKYYAKDPSRSFYWAIDNVSLTGTAQTPPTISWSSNPAGFTSTLANPISVIVPRTTIYTATYVDASTNCPGSASVTVTGIPPADATITADYCSVPGMIQLTAHPGPTGFAYQWTSRSETTQVINVNMVSNYTVQVTDVSTGCIGLATLPVSNELVTDGTFTNFVAASPSFITEYKQQQSYYNPAAANPGLTGLWPEGDYAVNTSAWYDPTPKTGYHPNFHGRDHTNNTVGSRNFLLVNGSTVQVSSPLRQMIIWQQTVTVKKNSDYYFSAWGMNLNPSNPAQLQFEVNGVLVGTIADLNVAPKPASEAEVAQANWVNFYSNPKWSSGSATTAVIRIRNLNTIANGNDFGLDDISFGSLDPAPSTVAPTASGTVCAGGTITLYSNVVGGKYPYQFTWTGPNGFTSADSIPVITNAVAASSGTYRVSMVDGYGCAPVTGTVNATVNALTQCSITGTDILCPNSAGHTYTAPPGMLTYLWSITNGTIVGSAISQNVSVTTGANCAIPVTLTLKVADANCSNICVKSIILQDITAWTTTAGNLNRTVECSDAAGLISAQSLKPAATSSCTAVITPIKTSGLFVPAACPQSGTYTNTWTFTDACGNAIPTAYKQVITITDTNPPVWTTAATALNRSLNCSDAAGLTAALLLAPVATDACAPSVTYTMGTDITTPGACAGIYTRNRTWTAKDNCDNTSSVFTQMIQVTDNVAPVWDQAALALDATLECTNASGLAAALAQIPTAKDACGSGVTIVLVNDNTTAGGCSAASTRIREWSATDGCLNKSALYRQTIVVRDITAPLWTTPQGGLDVILECSDASGIATAQAMHPVASDNCDADVTNIIKSAGVFVAGTCPQSGSYTNTWRVTDDCGNISAVYTQVITLEDNTVPDLTRPADMAISCSDSSAPSATGTATAKDNCDKNPIITYQDVINAGSCPGNFTIYRTWSVVDKCGNSTTSLQKIFVQDVDPPVVSCMISGNQTKDTNSGNMYLHSNNSWNATATDGCSSFTLTASLGGATTASALLTLNGVSFNIGVTTVTWTALDACGNMSSCSFTVTVNAGADLSITISALPKPVTLGQNLTYTISVTNLGPSTASNIVVNESLPSGLKLVSFASNLGVWNGSSTWTINSLPFKSVATLTISATTSLNNCSAFTNLVTVTSATLDPVISNNSATDITPVIDGTNPIITTCPVTRIISGCTNATITGPVFSNVIAASSYAEYSNTTNQGVSSDNCAITSVTYQDISNVGSPFVVTRTWTLYDAAGNMATCNQRIEVTDTGLPTFTPPAPFVFCVGNLSTAAYISSALKVNPDPDYALVNAGSSLFDLNPILNNFNDNCCAVNSLIIRWRIDFTDTPNQIPPPTILTHPSISGAGQPSLYGLDIQLPGDGVTFTTIVHKITYWLVDCNGNKSADQTVNITVNPRPKVK